MSDIDLLKSEHRDLVTALRLILARARDATRMGQKRYEITLRLPEMDFIRGIVRRAEGAPNDDAV